VKPVKYTRDPSRAQHADDVGMQRDPSNV
jgi:hypothetical protein